MKAYLKKGFYMALIAIIIIASIPSWAFIGVKAATTQVRSATPPFEPANVDDFFARPNGNAVVNNNVVALASNSYHQAGSIWSKEKADLTKDFTLEAYLYFGSAHRGIADGITFTLQNDSRGRSALGDDGQALGAYSINSRNTYIKNAFSIEFDSYFNGDDAHGFDRGLSRNSDKGHVAFTIPKATGTGTAYPHSQVKYPSDFLSNGQWRKLTVSWNASNKYLTYNFEGVGSDSIYIDTSARFNSSQVYWGFTGSTGDVSGVNDFALAITKPLQVKHKVTGVYVDESGRTLAPSEVVEDKEGASYSLPTKSITGYELKEITGGSASGTIGTSDKTITFVYQKVVYIGTAHYVDKDTNESISADQILRGTMGENYNFTQKEIPHYTFDSISGRKTGVFIASNVETIFYYKKTNYSVKAHYLDVDTNEKLLTDKTVTGVIGSAYEFPQETIPGYTFERIEGNKSGTIAENNSDVTFYYKKNNYTATAHYKEMGTNEELAEDETVTGHIHDDYTLPEKEIPGYRLVNTEGTPNGKFNTSNVEVTYYYEKINFTATAHYKEVGTEATITPDETKTGTMGSAYELTQKEVPGYRFVSVQGEPSGHFGTSNVEVTYYYEKINYTATAHYKEVGTGATISSDEVKTGHINDPYELTQKEIPGYRFVELQGEPSGRFGTANIEVTYYYEKIDYTATAHYKEVGTEATVAPDQIVTGHIHDPYELTQKEIPGYRFVEVQGKPKDNFATANVEVTYYYEKIDYTATAHYKEAVTEKTIGEDQIVNGHITDNYELEEKSFPGYRLVSIEGEPTGKFATSNIEVTFYYEKIDYTVTGHYIDEDTGETLSEDEIVTGHYQDNYELPEKEIPGYTLSAMQGSPTGKIGVGDQEVTFIYEQNVYTVTGHYIDKETGESISADESVSGHYQDPYNLTEKEISGYVLVSMQGSPQGKIGLTNEEVTFIYEKVGQIRISQAPTKIKFGRHKIPNKTKKYDMEDYDRDLIVTDTRASVNRSSWKIKAKVSKELTNRHGDKLQNALYFQNNNKTVSLSKSGATIYQQADATKTNKVNVSKEWKDKKVGPKLKVNGNKVKAGNYSGEITWTLEDTPNK